MERTHRWELSDVLWARAEPLLPAAKLHPKGGRPPRSDREMLGAILYMLRTRGEERLDAASRDPLKRPRRWVVERLHSWLNRSRRLLVRWEKLARTYTAFVHRACALLCFQQCDRIKTALVSE